MRLMALVWREVSYNASDLKIVNHVGINNTLPSSIMDVILKTTIAYSFRRGFGLFLSFFFCLFQN